MGVGPVRSEGDIVLGVDVLEHGHPAQVRSGAVAFLNYGHAVELFGVGHALEVTGIDDGVGAAADLGAAEAGIVLGEALEDVVALGLVAGDHPQAVAFFPGKVQPVLGALGKCDLRVRVGDADADGDEFAVVCRRGVFLLDTGGDRGDGECRQRQNRVFESHTHMVIY